MRVLHFLPVYAPAWQFGGPILSVSRLCEGLVLSGVEVRVITTNAGLPDFPSHQLCIPQTVNGVQVTYYPVDYKYGSICSKELVASLPDHMGWAEVLHLSSIWQPLGIPVQQAAHSYGVPVIQSLRGALGPYSWRRGWWKKIPYYLLKEMPALQHASALHCTTSQEAREIAWLRLRPPVHFLPNPLELSQLNCNPQLGYEWRIKMGITLVEPLLLVVGRLHHKKGLDLLPEVLKRVAHQQWQIVFIGIDEDGTGLRLRRSFRRLGLEDRCHWLEQIPAEQLSGPYNASDCLLLPSRHENFGNVVAEALACGSAVLISDKVGLADTIQNCPGVTIAPRSLHCWLTSLQSILQSTRPGKLSSEWVVHHFSQALVASQALHTYTSIATHE